MAFIKQTKNQVEAAQILRDYLSKIVRDLALAEAGLESKQTPSEQSASPALTLVPALVESRTAQVGAEPVSPHLSPAKPGEDIPPLGTHKGRRSTPKHIYCYKDPAGRPISAVLRYENQAGKSFAVATLVRNLRESLEWIYKAPPIPRPLYNLDQLASKPTAPVIICEGEKAADATAKHLPDWVSTTTMNGAQSPQRTDLTPLAGRQVMIWPDNDKPGQEFAQTMARLLMQLVPAPTVRILKPICTSATFDAEGKPTLQPGFVPSPGWDAADALESGWTPAHVELLVRDEANSYAFDNPAGQAEPQRASRDSSLDGVPPEYVVKDAGVFFVKKSDKYETLVWLSSRIDVIGLARTNDGKSWGTRVRFNDRDGNTHHWCIPTQMFGAERAAVVSYLLEKGAQVSSSDGNRTLLMDYLQQCEPSPRSLAATQAGWNGESFVLPDGSAFGTALESIEFLSSTPDQGEAFQPRGDLAAWHENVARYCEGNSILTLAVCAALTGPVLRLLGEENGGVHFRGASSIGKTTALLPASSVWGNPDKFMKRWRATSNGIEGTATLHNDMLLPLDEMAQVSPQEAGEVVYMLGNGQGKARANVKGALRPSTQWRLITLSTGEIGLADHMAAAGKRAMAGQEARLVDIPADPGAGHGIFEVLHGLPSGAELAREIKRRCAQHYGVAGRAWLQVLTAPETRQHVPEKLRHLIDELEQEWVAADANGQIARVGHRFALMAAVGEVCIEHGILPWDEGSAIAGVQKCFDAWLAQRGGNYALEEKQALEQVRRHLLMYGESNFAALDRGTYDPPALLSVPARQKHGFRDKRKDGRWDYFVTADAFTNEVCRGMDSKLVSKVLQKHGFLHVDEKGGRSSISKNIPGEGQLRVYHIDADLLQTGDTVPTDGGPVTPAMPVQGQLMLVSTNGATPDPRSSRAP